MALLDFCNRVFKTGEPVNTIPGLCYRENGRIILNQAKRVDDLSAFPFPDRKMLDYDYPMKLDFFNLKADFIMTSRGCPAACDFCSAQRMFPGGVRLRPIENVKREVENLIKTQNIEALKIFDSTFTAVREHVLAFCEMIKPFNLKWECEVRANTVDYELLEVMYNSGCVYINMGMETTSSRILKTMAKQISVEQVENVLKWCRDIGIRTKVFFTFGHIDEIYSECLEDLKYMKTKSNDIDFFATTIGMRVYPGTALEFKAKKAGLIPNNFSWANYKPSIKNILLFEPSDILILEQKQLSIFKMFKLIFRLFLQNTILSPDYIYKMVLSNGTSIIKLAERELRYTWHRFSRVVNPIK